MTATAGFEVRLRFSANSYALITDDVISFSINRELARQFNDLSVGRADVVLDNALGWYSPARSDTPYAGLLRPRTVIEILSTDTTSGTAFILDLSMLDGGHGLFPMPAFFSGYVDSFDVQPALSGPRQTVLRCTDYISELAGQRIDTNVLTNITVANAIAAVLDQGGLDPSLRDVDAIDDVLPFVWFKDTTLATAINEILQAGAYAAYVSASGVLSVRDRYFDLGGSVVGSYDEFLGLTFSRSSDEIINAVRVRGMPRTISSSLQTVARLGEVLTIPASSSVGFWLDYQDPKNSEPAPAVGMLLPVPTVDWTTNAASTGLGLDKTAVCTARVGLFGETAVATVSNLSAATVYLTKFGLRGLSAQRDAEISVEVDEAVSQGLYGLRAYSVESRLIGNRAYAESLANAVLSLRANDIDRLSMSLRNAGPSMVLNDLSQVVWIVNSHLGVADQFTIVGISHDVSADHPGWTHTVTYDLDLARTGSTLILDDAERGKLDFYRLAR